MRNEQSGAIQGKPQKNNKQVRKMIRKPEGSLFTSYFTQQTIVRRLGGGEGGEGGGGAHKTKDFLSPLPFPLFLLPELVANSAKHCLNIIHTWLLLFFQRLCWAVPRADFGVTEKDT